MNLLIAFGFGWVASSLYSQYWAKVKPAVGRALAVVFGKQSAPTPAFVTEPANSENRLQTASKQSLTLGAAAKNILGFFVGLIAWCARNPMLAIGLAVLALFLVVGAPSCSPFGKSKGELRLERELAEANARVLEIENERDAEIAQVARDVAVIRAQIRIASQRGQDEIAAAAPENEAPIDDGLAAAFHDALDGLCIQRADGSLANSCGSGA